MNPDQLLLQLLQQGVGLENQGRSAMNQGTSQAFQGVQQTSPYLLQLLSNMVSRGYQGKTASTQLPQYQPPPQVASGGTAPVKQQVAGGFDINKQMGVHNPMQSNTQTAQAKQPAYIQHVVKPGETLWQIAQHYTGDGNNWKNFEGFHSDPRSLQPGTVLHIPTKGTQNVAQAKPSQGQNLMPSHVFGTNLA